jgi:acyl dehydratase
MTGRYFEEFAVGEAFESGSRLVTQADVEAFAAVSGDVNPLHLDAEYAATTRFGRPIAHGLLGLSIATGLLGGTGLSRGTLIALTGLEWTFLAPIYPGTEVSLLISVAELHESKKPGCGRLVCGVELVDAAGEVLQKGRIKALMRTRDQSSQSL